MKHLFINRSANKVLLLTLIIGFGTLISCKSDILDKKPLDAISEDAVFSDPVFLQNYVYNVYNGIKPPWSPGSGSFETLTDIAVDQPETHDRAKGIRQFTDRTITADNITDLTNIWNEEYSYISKVNFFFEKIETSEIAQDKLDQMSGEMHFLRAWMYFELMRSFGGVPIITNTFDLEATSFDVPRNTYDECKDFVLEECDKAINFLRGVPVNEGKISKNAALALKARMLLYAASPLNNPSNDLAKWQAAEVATDSVLKAGYSLHPEQTELFYKPLKNDETIFGKSFTPATRIPDWGYNYDYWPSGFDARLRLMPTQAFVNMFQMTNGEYPYLADGVTKNPASGYDDQKPNLNRDPRYYASIIYPGAGPVNIIDGAKSTERLYEYWEDANPNVNENPNKIDPKNGQNLFDFGRDSKSYWVKGLTPFHWKVQTGYTFRKLTDFNGPRASYDFNYNQVVVFMRLAEFYLNYAEIQIALGNEEKAREYINLVRKRPSTNMPDITATGAELVRVYRNERAIELHLEDSRFFDLRRWKAAAGTMDVPVRGLTSVLMDWRGVPAGTPLGKLSYTYGPILDAEERKPWPGDHFYLFPIPNDEIRKSNNALEQNPGY